MCCLLFAFHCQDAAASEESAALFLVSAESQWQLRQQGVSPGPLGLVAGEQPLK
jgi:hypothetical protein